MGTVVLFPQDCFASHNGRRNQACSPLAHPISRTSVGSQSPTFVGLSSPHTVRVDSISQTVPAASEVSSATCYTKSQLWSSRSLSADRTMRNSSRRGNKVSVVERPSILVGRNGVANLSAPAIAFDKVALPENGRFSKSPDTKSSRRGTGLDDLPRKPVSFIRAMNACDVVGDLRNKTQADCIPRKGVAEGDSTKLPRKDEDARKVRKGRSDKLAVGQQTGHAAETQPNTGFATPPPVVTILQRPKTREAAQELLAKFKWKTEFASSVNSDVWEGDAAFPSLKPTESLLRSCSDVGTLGQNMNGSLEWHLSKPSNLGFFLQSNKETDDEAMNSITIDCLQRDKARSTPACKTEIASSTASAFTEGIHLCKNGGSVQNKTSLEDCQIGTFAPSLPLTADERWAGPGYTNSPPPSSLPLPTFSLKHLRSSFAELHPTSRKEQLMENSGSLGGVGLPSFPIVVCGPGLITSERKIDVAFATKDLRRLLNLDSC